jgi:hypothetical protein
MPSKPQWLLRVPEIIDALGSMTAPVLDRASLESLFRVSRRRAIQLLHRFEGYQVGKTFLVDRQELVRQLQVLRNGEAFSREKKRRGRVLDELEEVSRLQRARAVKFAVSRAEVEQARGLPEGVRIEQGRLVVDFEGIDELLSRLFTLSQSAARDFPAFKKAISKGSQSDAQST